MRLKADPRSLLRFVFFDRLRFRLLILTTSFFAAIFGLMGPFFQKQFVDLLTGSKDELTISHLLNALGDHPLLFLIGSFFCLLATLLLNALTNYLGAKESLVMQSKLAGRLYEKTLELRSDSLKGRTIGEIVSVYAVDVPGATTFLDQSLPFGASIAFPLILAPLALVLLFHLPWLACLAIMGALISFLLIMAFRQSVFFFRFKKLAADRIGLVNEWVQNIRTLRILGWVTPFEEKIHKVRVVETENRVTMVTNGQTMNAVSSSVTFALNILAIAYLAYFIPGQLTAGTLVALLWVVAIFLTRPFRQLPWFFTFLFDSWTSLKRVSDVLMLENQESHVRPTEFVKLRSLKEPEPALKVRGLNLKINGETILHKIDFDVKSGEFVTVVGEVGSGKSLLLLSLLGETGAHFETFQIGNELNALSLPLDQLRQFFTFVPQEGFIMSGSLRDNVVFEYDASPTRDLEVLASLKLAQLDLQSESTPLSLDTEIGERGVNLSGGQKQRISIARVDFHRSPIILLDDCLSAVDVDTEERLIEDLISGAWCERTRILVTHRLSVLKESDRVIFLKNGTIHAQGTFHELLRRSQEFRVFADSVARETNASKNALPTATEESQ